MPLVLLGKEDNMRVEIGYEVRKRISQIIDVTEEQLQKLRNGENPFEEVLYKDAIENGYEETDYSVNDMEGREIIPWS